MTIEQERRGDVLIVTLDRVEAGNRLDADTIDALTEIYETAKPLAGGPHVIVLAANGPDFSLGRQRPAEQSADPLAITAEFERIQRLNDAVRDCRAVTVSAMEGRAEGAGLSLAARVDIAVAAENAQLCFPEIPHGIPPTIVLSHYRYILPAHLLGDLIYTGRVVEGRDAVTMGLAARIAVPGEAREDALRIAQQIAESDQRSIALVKEFLRRTRTVPMEQAAGLGISMYANEIGHRLLAREGAKPTADRHNNPEEEELA